MLLLNTEVKSAAISLLPVLVIGHGKTKQNKNSDQEEREF